MPVFRVLILLALLAAAASFALYVFTGDRRHRRRGGLIFRWTLFAAFVFFAVLAIERLW